MPAQPARVLLSVVVCVAVYLLPFELTHGRIDVDTLFRQPGGVVHALSTVLLFGYVFVNHYVLVPHFFLRRRYWAYGLLLLAFLALVLWLPHFFRGLEHHDEHIMEEHGEGVHGHHGHGPKPGVPGGLTYNLVLFVIATFGSISMAQQRRLLEMQREKLRAELSFLKAQINPHFLFNTLNSIYALAIAKSEDTPKAITELSDLMRYILKDSEAYTVPLEKELGYIANYVALQRRRLGNTARVEYEATVADTNRPIAPLILMSFVENAVKHGINPSEDSAISIRVNMQGDRLRFRVQNNKVSAANRDEGMGIGLSNAIARLRHFYEGRHELHVDDTGKTYSVELTLDLHDKSHCPGR